MKRVFKKYFVVSLSLMLILSNFSFATQLMFCEMSGDNNECQCTHNDNKKYEGVSLTQEKTKCCSEETTELSNTNTLLNLNSGQEHDAYVNIALFLISTIDLDVINNRSLHFSPDKSHLPEIDIPIFTSSLLI